MALHIAEFAEANIANAIDALFFWQPGHCALAYEWERGRRDLPGDYRADL